MSCCHVQNFTEEREERGEEGDCWRELEGMNQTSSEAAADAIHSLVAIEFVGGGGADLGQGGGVGSDR